MIPIPVFDVFETPAKVSQLAMLEQRAAIRLLRTAHKVGRTVHFHRNPLPIIQSHERVDAVPGDLATMLLLYIGNVTGRTDLSDHVGLQLGSLPFFFDKSVTAGLPQRLGQPWPQRAELLAPERPLMQL